MKTSYQRFNPKRCLNVGALLMGLALAGWACSGDELAPDTEAPVIHMDVTDAFPSTCETLVRGNTYTFRAKFTDNVSLGSFSLDVHHNFDHHSHGTEGIPCEFGPDREPVTPFLFMKTYDIPEGLREYIAEAEIVIPDGVDAGDYHFTIKLTDKNGWSTRRGISIKIADAIHDTTTE